MQSTSQRDWPFWKRFNLQEFRSASVEYDVRVTYWLGEIIDEFEISTQEKAKKRLSDTAFRKRVQEVATSASSNGFRPPKLESQTTYAIAGRNLDLSGISSCNGLSCLVREADEGLTQIWQLFDNAIVEGLDPQRYLNNQERDSLASKHTLAAQLNLYLHLRSVGSLEGVTFSVKPYQNREDTDRTNIHGITIPPGVSEASIETAIKILETEGSYKITNLPNGLRSVGIGHEELVPFMSQTVRPGLKVPTKHEMAVRTVRRASDALWSDVEASKKFRLPLVSDASTEFRLLDGTSRPLATTPDVVAVNLRIPMLMGLRSYELLALKREFPDEFIAFRAATMTSIREQVQLQGSGDPIEIANRVNREILEPAAARLNRQLKTSMKTFLGTTGVQVIVGGILTTVGLVEHFPLILGAGAFSVGLSGLMPGGSFPNLMTMRSTTSLDEFYFLHLAQRELHRHANSEH